MKTGWGSSCRNTLARLGAAMILVGSVSCARAQQVTGVTNLDQLRDRSRPLLIFAPKPDDPRLEIQMRTLAEHAAEARDRDIVGIALPFNNPGNGMAELSSSGAEDARRRFHVQPSDFVVILLGKDGGSKLRSTKPLSMEKLGDTIDAMPMRQEEMKAHPGH